MLKSTATSLILTGVLALIAGVLALAWPGVTILALIILFAVYLRRTRQAVRSVLHDAA